MTDRPQLSTTAADLGPATLTRPEPTPWGRFLDHAVGCTNCRAGQRCTAGDGLHHAVRVALAAAAP